MKAKRMAKMAGFSLVGFVAASLIADRVPLGSALSQAAGLAGAFLGSLAGLRKPKRSRTPTLENKP